jgi:hypothetical protein
MLLDASIVSEQRDFRAARFRAAQFQYSAFSNTAISKPKPFQSGFFEVSTDFRDGKHSEK